MSSVQINQKSYEMPPREGMSIAHFLTVGDINRSLDYYEKVFGARILSRGDGNAPGSDQSPDDGEGGDEDGGGAEPRFVSRGAQRDCGQRDRQHGQEPGHRLTKHVAGDPGARSVG